MILSKLPTLWKLQKLTPIIFKKLSEILRETNVMLLLFSKTLFRKRQIVNFRLDMPKNGLSNSIRS